MGACVFMCSALSLTDLQSFDRGGHTKSFCRKTTSIVYMQTNPTFNIVRYSAALSPTRSASTVEELARV